MPHRGPALATTLLLLTAPVLAACSGDAEDDVRDAAATFLDAWSGGELAEAAGATTDPDAATALLEQTAGDLPEVGGEHGLRQVGGRLLEQGGGGIGVRRRRRGRCGVTTRPGPEEAARGVPDVVLGVPRAGREDRDGQHQDGSGESGGGAGACPRRHVPHPLRRTRRSQNSTLAYCPTSWKPTRW